jgi:hypothetical protein
MLVTQLGAATRILESRTHRGPGTDQRPRTKLVNRKRLGGCPIRHVHELGWLTWRRFYRKSVQFCLEHSVLVAVAGTVEVTCTLWLEPGYTLERNTRGCRLGLSR